MKMNFKKEVKHSVVYEVATEHSGQPGVAIESVYVKKAWLQAQGKQTWPTVIEVEVKVVS